MLIYNLIWYSDNCGETSRRLWKYCKDKWDDNDITDSKSFKFKSTFWNKTNNAGKTNVEIAVPVKYLSNFCRALKILLINFVINLILTW